MLPPFCSLVSKCAWAGPPIILATLLLGCTQPTPPKVANTGVVYSVGSESLSTAERASLNQEAARLFPGYYSKAKGAALVFPVSITQTALSYPGPAKRARRQGPVRLLVLVSRTGSVSKVVPVGNPPPELVEATAKAIRTWQFRPGTINGKPEESVTVVPLRFTLTPDVRLRDFLHAPPRPAATVLQTKGRVPSP